MTLRVRCAAPASAHTTFTRRVIIGYCKSSTDDVPETNHLQREFDPGSESTLAACLRHASRTRKEASASE